MRDFLLVKTDKRFVLRITAIRITTEYITRITASIYWGFTSKGPAAQHIFQFFSI